eukprot:TRINITY_DN7639_c0_g2_i1.p1 TRINITY_DN7639_c0_g2~~TRINITY_DN7639_c0_g2_i1.p1  ORF type:complete len:275 (+),score=72.91 TRINITY_DN7639_c0_g2_i1:467-1291(+)
MINQLKEKMNGKTLIIVYDIGFQSQDEINNFIIKKLQKTFPLMQSQNNFYISPNSQIYHTFTVQNLTEENSNINETAIKQIINLINKAVIFNKKKLLPNLIDAYYQVNKQNYFTNIEEDDDDDDNKMYLKLGDDSLSIELSKENELIVKQDNFDLTKKFQQNIKYEKVNENYFYVIKKINNQVMLLVSFYEGNVIIKSCKLKNCDPLIAEIEYQQNEESKTINIEIDMLNDCLLYTSDAADEEDSVDLGGRRIIKKKKKTDKCNTGKEKNRQQH